MCSVAVLQFSYSRPATACCTGCLSRYSPSYSSMAMTARAPGTPHALSASSMVGLQKIRSEQLLSLRSWQQGQLTQMMKAPSSRQNSRPPSATLVAATQSQIVLSPLPVVRRSRSKSSLESSSIGTSLVTSRQQAKVGGHASVYKSARESGLDPFKAAELSWDSVWKPHSLDKALKDTRAGASALNSSPNSSPVGSPLNVARLKRAKRASAEPRLERAKVGVEHTSAQALGIQSQQLMKEAHDVFGSIDKDYSGTIDMDELDSVRALRCPPTF